MYKNLVFLAVFFYLEFCILLNSVFYWWYILLHTAVFLKNEFSFLSFPVGAGSSIVAFAASSVGKEISESPWYSSIWQCGFAVVQHCVYNCLLVRQSRERGDSTVLDKLSPVRTVYRERQANLTDCLISKLGASGALATDPNLFLALCWPLHCTRNRVPDFSLHSPQICSPLSSAPCSYFSPPDHFAWRVSSHLSEKERTGAAWLRGGKIMGGGEEADLVEWVGRG